MTTTDTPSRQPAPLVDPTYYAELWGTKPARRHRDAWSRLRGSAAGLAALAGAGLLIYLLLVPALT